LSGIATFHDLDWALNLNPDMKLVLWGLYSNRQHYLKMLDDLISSIRSRSCSGIQGKAADANHIDKFEAMIAELRIARFLLDHNKSVTLLPDNYMGHQQSPDILVTDATTEAYVEVKLFTRDDICDEIIIEGLRAFLQQSTKNVIVNIELGKELSLPRTTFNERNAKITLAETSLQQFKDVFETLDFSRLPIPVKTNSANFVVSASPINRSIVGSMRSTVYSVPSSLKKKLEDDICQKANKRNSWTDTHRSKPFFIGIYCDEFGIDENDVEDILFGARSTVAGCSPLPPVSIPCEIPLACKRGWRSYLESKYLIPRDRTYLDWTRKGIYFTRSETQNISGVIVGRESSSYSFTPNPFCVPEINNPTLASFI